MLEYTEKLNVTLKVRYHFKKAIHFFSETWTLLLWYTKRRLRHCFVMYFDSLRTILLPRLTWMEDAEFIFYCVLWSALLGLVWPLMQNINLPFKDYICKNGLIIDPPVFHSQNKRCREYLNFDCYSSAKS